MRRVVFTPEQHKRFLARTDADIVVAVKEAHEADGDEARTTALARLTDLMEEKKGILHNIEIDALPKVTKPAVAAPAKPVRKRASRAASKAPAAGGTGAEPPPPPQT